MTAVACLMAAMGATGSTASGTPPTITSFTETLVHPGQASDRPRTVPVKLAWAATSTSGQGICSYTLTEIRGTETIFVTLDSPTQTSVVVNVVAGFYIDSLTANDCDGGTAKANMDVSVDLYRDQTGKIHYSKGWVSAPLDGAINGSTTSTSTAGATATITFDYGNQIGWIAPKGPSEGSADIYIDGTLIRSVNLHATAAEPRRVVFADTYSPGEAHTLQIVALGTRTHPRVDIDGLTILQLGS